MFWDQDAVSRHEAAHCAAYVACGIIPASVSVRYDGKNRGFVAHPPDFAVRDRASALIVARSVMCAWLAEAGRPEAWPLSGRTGDEQDMANLARGLGWGREDYERFVIDTRAFMETPAFTRPYSALLGALQRTPFLDSAQIKQVVGIHHKPRLEQRGFATSWQTKSATANGRDPAAAPVLEQVEDWLRREQDARAAKYAKEAA